MGSFVTASMRDGWQPYGTPFAIEGGVAQAMVREEEDNAGTVDRTVHGPLSEMYRVPE